MTADTLIRLLPFAGAVLLLLGAEQLMTARPFAGWRRWLGNVAIGGFNAALLLILPVAPVVAALVAGDSGWGLMRLLQAAPVVEAVIVLLALDLLIYWQHRLLHTVSWLWPLHRYHHADGAIDVTTGVRFNPAEILFSALLKSTVVILLGAPVAVVIAYELALSLMALFAHANVRLPGWLDRRLRAIVVTPAFHLVHHGADGEDMNHNFSATISVWDRMFASYRAQMTSPAIGLAPPGGLPS